MNEEEKKAIELLSKKNTEYYYRYVDVRGAVSIVLNLIENQQKELNNLKEIEKSHKEENGKLREEIIRLDNVLKAKKQEIAYLKIQISSDKIFYFSDKDYISKDKIKAKINEYDGLKIMDKLAYEEQVKPLKELLED